MVEQPAERLDRSSYELEIEDTFDANTLDPSLWVPHYLPQWSSREASAARYALGDGLLRLRIDADQQPWCPEWDGSVRASSLQTGVFSGPLGSPIGQHHFRPELVVREAQKTERLYTPHYGLIECRARAIADPACLVALWMIGFEDEPERSAEICVFEIFGRDVASQTAAVGMGIRPFGDAAITADFERPVLSIDACEFHDYAAEWTPGSVRFFVDEGLVREVRQSPAYPMQLMLNIYEFTDASRPVSAVDAYPKEFAVDRVRGWRRRSWD
jgi:Glycosyl hydrolases family 16